jgi:uncharacterized YccA/Bax inhibitor family protein
MATGSNGTTGTTATRPTRGSNGSFGARSNYNRLVANFSSPAVGTGTGTDQYQQGPDGSWARWNGSAWVPSAAGPPSVRPPVTDVRPFVAAEVFNKVLLLSAIALIFGVGAALVHVPVGLAVVCMVAALVVAVITIFRPHRAPVLAPIFAALEGVTLGVVSKLFVGQDAQIIPLAIIGTTVIFFGVLGAYRTGLVRVGPAFVRATVIAGFGLLAVIVATWLGLQVPGTSQGTTYFIVFGVLYLVVAVMDLFVDFAYVDRAERAGLSHEGEWFAAFSIMISVVMIYLALLRIFGGRR